MEEGLSEKIPGLVRTSHETGRQKVERTVEEAIWRTLRPWQRQTRMRRARYWYIGRSIDAVIMDDGTVETRPKEGVTLSLLTVMAPDSGGQAGGLPNARGGGDDASHSLGSPKFGLKNNSEAAAGGFGISISQAGRVFDRWMTGKAPLNVEERAFMEQTQPLREHLIAVAAARNAEQAGKRLDEKLRRIWATPGPLLEKQMEIFARWDECAEDEEGDRARARIEAFVRSLEDQREACPYSDEDLIKLNGVRDSKRVFAPCATHESNVRSGATDAG